MSKQEKAELRNLFKGYKRMDRAMRLKLAAYNLMIITESKHYKIMRIDQKGGFCTLPKTASDIRSGLNFSSYLIKLLDNETN